VQIRFYIIKVEYFTQSSDFLSKKLLKFQIIYGALK